MKKDELKSIIPDITGDQIDQLMKLHGADIERHKQQIATLTAERDAAAEKLDGMQREFEFQNAARAAMAEIEFSSNAARKTFEAELRAKNLPVQEGKIIGFDEFFAAARQADPGAFGLMGYPAIKDSGEIAHPPSLEPRALFSEWFNSL